MTMKIYFAASIRGGGNDAEIYKQIILHLRTFGDVIGGEHIDKEILSKDISADDKYIYERDKQRLDDADVLVAEVTTPSLGVGFEIGMFVQTKKRVLCLYRPASGKKLSAMIAGSPGVIVAKYRDINDVKEKIDEFFAKPHNLYS